MCSWTVTAEPPPMVRYESSQAGVAQLVEQLIRNQQVRGSSPRAGSSFTKQSATFRLPRLPSDTLTDTTGMDAGGCSVD